MGRKTHVFSFNINFSQKKNTKKGFKLDTDKNFKPKKKGALQLLSFSFRISWCIFEVVLAYLVVAVTCCVAELILHFSLYLVILSSVIAFQGTCSDLKLCNWCKDVVFL